MAFREYRAAAVAKRPPSGVLARVVDPRERIDDPARQTNMKKID
jgi:hypothetical protein